VVSAYDSGEGEYADIREDFERCPVTPCTARCGFIDRTGGIRQRPIGIATPSSIDPKEISDLVDRLGDTTAKELTTQFNRKRQDEAMIHVSSMKSALHHFGHVIDNVAGCWKVSALKS